LTHNESVPNNVAHTDEPILDNESDFEPEELTAEEVARWDLARTALLEVTGEETIGDPADEVDEGEGVISYLFENLMPGYPGWKWTVTIAQIEDSAPTILETELTPADGALVAPDWIPWAERMDDYRAAQVALGEDLDDEESDEDDEDADDLADSDEDDSDDDDSDDDDDESDDEDDDDEFEDPTPVLHGGDLDGVDIDELDTDSEGADNDADAEPVDDTLAAESVVDEAPAELAPVEETAPEALVYVAEPFDLSEPEAEPASAPEPEVKAEAEPAVAAIVEDDRYAEPVVAPVRGARRSRRATTATVFADKPAE